MLRSMTGCMHYLQAYITHINRVALRQFIMFKCVLIFLLLIVSGKHQFGSGFLSQLMSARCIICMYMRFKYVSYFQTALSSKFNIGINVTLWINYGYFT